MEQSNYFFNSYQTLPKEFWDRNFDVLLNTHGSFYIQNDNCISFYKRSKVFKKWLPRLYSVQGSYLLYGDVKLKGFRKLDNVYLETAIVSDPYKYQFTLIYCGLIHKFCTDQKKDFDYFKEILQSHCILTDFHTQYNIQRQIGFGSSAQVYIGRNNYNSQYYAIKRILKNYAVKQKKCELEQSLMNEIKILKDLNHPNIISFVQVFETNKHINIVLELIQGGELLKQSQYKSIRDARVVMKQLALCVDYMHQKGIMHRDLKPQNILCKQNSLDVLIADFGLATYIKEKKQQYYRCGTTGYVAPEVLTYKDGGKMYSEKCDIFSLGVIFYQLIFNQHPFKDATKAGMLKKNLAVDYKIDESIKIPQSCKDLLNSMLRENPKHRPSASQILRHDFFNEALNELSYPSLVGSFQDQEYQFTYHPSEQKRSAQSFNSQVGDIKLSTFQKNFFSPPLEKNPLVSNFLTPRNSGNDFKELSPVWNKRIEFQKVSVPRSKAQSLYSNKNLDVIRNPKISIFRQQSKNVEFDLGIEPEIHQSPYQSFTNRCVIKNK